jgi:pyruvate decarboxylase
MAPFTVGDYLAERLAQIGVRHHFIVPGDYNLILLDKLEAHPALTEVGCTNELNCSLAAEGYTRANGVGACIVTYSVGAFSAFNGVGSAYAENLPLVLVSGAPNTNDVGQRLLHHTLGDYDFTYQLEMAKKITCCAVAIRGAVHVPELIDQAIRLALLKRKPAYIEIPTNLSGETCARPGPISALVKPTPSDEPALDAAVARASGFLSTKQKLVILVGPKVRRAGAEQALLRLVEAIGCAVVLQPAAKGSFPEDHAQFAGIF